MTLKEIKEILDLMVEKGLTEFELERSGTKLRLRRDLYPLGNNNPLPLTVHYEPPPLPEAPPVGRLAPSTETPPEPPAAENLHLIKSPIVGTFYEAPSPGASPFVKIGDTVEAGQTLCIIEAMKLMNEIETDVAGEVVKRHVSNGQPVEYGEVLFSIRRKSKK